MTKELLTPAEFQALYNISHTTFYREVNAKRIAIIKIGRATRITRETGIRWLAEKIQQSENDECKTDGTTPQLTSASRVTGRS